MKQEGEVVASTWVARGMASEGLGCLSALAIIALVIVGVNVVVGEEELPKEIEGTTPYFVGAAIFFGLLAFWWYRRTRVRAELVAEEGKRVLRVGQEVRIAGPAQLVYGWQKFHVRAGIYTVVLKLGVIQEGRCLLILSAEQGMIHGAPEGWPEAWPTVPNPPPNAYKLLGKASFMEAVIRELR